jgi:hypothetical protein
MIIQSYSISSPVKGICKQHAAWGMTGNCAVPLIYLQRPKWITDDAVWENIVESVRLVLPDGLDVS